jgi:L-ascorbate metabolism protein UlaG (beta-lactamase superfamily)
MACGVMEITFLGHASFKIKGKQAIVVTDPFDPKVVGLKFPRVQADIVTISHEHDDHSMAELVNGVRKVIDGPGEYEIKGVSILGLPSFHDDKKGNLRGKNTVYVIEMNGLRVVHLGDLGHKLSDKLIESIGEVDVLMVPVGGEYTIGASIAVQVVRAIEPRITIPMHYKMEGLNSKRFSKLAPVKPFLSELGLSVEKASRLTVKKSALGEEQKVVVLEKR